ncbi:unnamed protein product [Symbiodinium natans]|uniref:Acyltransferase 3 domain-containing protein n=1 Tax=Symbiodinium natans TaxID=878477 RepID=A0A812KMF2_9DINO|nr:unnamed protein product [Symbiodinium natans]
MGGGSMGLFYIISGFVMAVGYCQVMLQPCCGRCGGEPNLPKLSACSFWLRRLVRLAPTYFLTNCLGVALKAAFAPEALNEITTVQFVLSGLGLTSWYIVAPVGNGLTWTISTMLFFYLCFPVLGPAMQRVSVPFLRVLAWAMYLLQAVFMIVGYVLNLGGYWIRMFPPARLPIFIMGICAGLSRVHGEQQRADEADACQTPVSRRDVPVEIGSKGWGMEACCPAWALIFIWTGLSLYGTTVTFICSHNLNFRFNLEVPGTEHAHLPGCQSKRCLFASAADSMARKWRFLRTCRGALPGDAAAVLALPSTLFVRHVLEHHVGLTDWTHVMSIERLHVQLPWLLDECTLQPKKTPKDFQLVCEQAAQSFPPGRRFLLRDASGSTAQFF